MSYIFTRLTSSTYFFGNSKISRLTFNFFYIVVSILFIDGFHFLHTISFILSPWYVIDNMIVLHPIQTIYNFGFLPQQSTIKALFLAHRNVNRLVLCQNILLMLRKLPCVNTTFMDSSIQHITLIYYYDKSLMCTKKLQYRRHAINNLWSNTHAMGIYKSLLCNSSC